MAYNPRYQMQFNDLEGASWVVSLCLSGYTGPVQQLALGPTPLTIRYDGDEDDIFDPIRTSKAELQIFMNRDEANLMDDTELISDKDFYVTIDCADTGYKWFGWLTPDLRTKQMRNDGYYVSMLAVDPFSYAKNALMQTMANGKPSGVLEGKQNLITYLATCISTALPSPDDFSAMITHVLNYDGADTSTSNPNADCLQMVACYAENFLDSNGRPKKGQDVMQNILKALGMITFMSQGNFHFRAPLALIAGQIRTNHLTSSGANVIYPNNLIRVATTKDFDETRFLVKNAELISKDRPAKEVSVHFDYNNIISIIPNSQFANAVPPNDDGSSVITGWDKKLLPIENSDGEVLTKIRRIGNGRNESPYAVRIEGRSNKLWEDGAFYHDAVSGFRATSFRQVKQGDKLNIEIKYQYAVSVGGGRMGGYLDMPGFPSNRSPRLIFQVILTNGSQEYQYFNSRTDHGIQNWVPNWYINTGQNQITCERTIIRSSPGISSYSYQTTPCPIDGEIKVRLLPIEFDFKNYQALPRYIDFVAINIGIAADVGGQQYTGEIHYQTQVSDYSLITDTDEVIIGDAPNDSVSGALYKGKNSVALTDKWRNVLEAANQTPKPLLQHLVRMKMFFSRMPKTKVDCVLYANDIFFEHLLQFRNGDQDLIPGRFMQMTDKYDVRNCTHELICTDLMGAYADGTDVYEYYQQTNDQ